MSFTSPDFADSVVTHLYKKGLISETLYHSGDLAKQSTAAIKVIDQLAKEAEAARAVKALKSAASAPAAQATAPGTRFMIELLDAHETLTDIGEQRGTRTLADCMYLLSAIQKGTSIEVHHPTMSEILEVVQALPSASEWMSYVHEVAE